ncbi:MAG: cation:proton antiporter [Planctomycetes bacterium]|nr:cation:proton antiporter [Planctomycetota bacterium]
MNLLAELGAGLILPGLLAASTVAGAVFLRRLSLSPCPIFVAIGLLVAVLPSIVPATLSGVSPAWASVLLFLPLLFSCGISLSQPITARSVAVPIALALPGLAVGVAILAWSTARILGIGPDAAALLALALAVPGPFAARSLRAVEPAAGVVADLVEQESAIAGAVAFSAAVAISFASNGSVPSIAGQEAARFLGGALVGVGMGALAVAILGRVTDPLSLVATSFFFGFGSFAAAEAFGLRGTAASAMAGIIVGARFLARHTVAAPPVRRTWEGLSLCASALGYVVLGTRIELRSLAGGATAILLIAAIAVVVRALIVFGFGGATRALLRATPFRWLHSLVWAGLPGAPSAAIAVAFLPATPSGEGDIDRARAALFGVLLVHAVLRLIPARLWARALGLTLVPPASRQLEELQARLLAVEAGLGSLDQFVATYQTSAAELEDLRLELQLRREALIARLRERVNDAGRATTWPRELVLREMLAAELAAIERARDRGLLPGGVAARVAEETEIEMTARVHRTRGGETDG